ncbi:hypothetical protein RUND412_004805, partial [Rhizina undulata]
MIHGNPDYEKPSVLVLAFHMFSSGVPDYNTALASLNPRSTAIFLTPNTKESLGDWAKLLKDKNRSKDATINTKQIKQPPSNTMTTSHIRRRRGVDKTNSASTANTSVSTLQSTPSQRTNQDTPGLAVGVGLKKSDQDNLMIMFWLSKNDEDSKLIEEIRHIILKERGWFKQWLLFKKLSHVSIKKYEKRRSGADYDNDRTFIDFVDDVDPEEASYLKCRNRYFQDLANRINGCPPPQGAEEKLLINFVTALDILYASSFHETNVSRQQPQPICRPKFLLYFTEQWSAKRAIWVTSGWVL